MHEQATLLTNHPTLGSVGHLVEITDVAKAFTSTQAASSINFKCANPNCGAPVKAIIPQASKPGRKKSPSAHFRAINRNKPHVSGCSLQTSIINTPNSTAVGTVPASPNQANVPTIWIDPLAQTTQASASITHNNANTNSLNSNNKKNSTIGNNTSQSKSQLVKRFADEWLAMNAQKQKTTSLIAPWNIGGTYHSAFHVFYPNNTTVDASKIGQKIHVGMLASLVKGTNNWQILLREKNMGNADVSITISDLVLNQYPQGNSLQTLLKSNLSSRAIYVLGVFTVSSSSINLDLLHPSYIYIT